MSTADEDWQKAREVVEPAVVEVVERVRAAGVEIGLFGAALVVVGSDIVNENDGPDRVVDLLEGLIETLEAAPKRPALRIVGEGSGAAGDGRGDV